MVNQGAPILSKGSRGSISNPAGHTVVIKAFMFQNTFPRATSRFYQNRIQFMLKTVELNFASITLLHSAVVSP